MLAWDSVALISLHGFQWSSPLEEDRCQQTSRSVVQTLLAPCLWIRWGCPKARQPPCKLTKPVVASHANVCSDE